MRSALIDDQILGAVLRGSPPRPVHGATLYTTGYWYVRLCRAVLGAAGRTGRRSGPFQELPDDLRERTVAALLELPGEIGLVSLRHLAPLIGRLRHDHSLNILNMEALAAARYLSAEVLLATSSPRLEAALAHEGLTVRVGG